jgi:hypothetical protein
MTMKKAAKSGAAKGKRTLVLRKETLADLSAKDAQAERIGGAGGTNKPTRWDQNHNETLVRARAARNVRANA